jgi:hypothetical protein
MRTEFWSENLKGRDNSEEISVNAKIIFECFLGKWDEKLWRVLVNTVMNIWVP